MKVKMIEHYQDARIHLSPEQVADVDDALGAWLLEHRKAEKVEEEIPAHTEESTGNYGKLPDFDSTLERTAEPMTEQPRKRGRK